MTSPIPEPDPSHLLPPFLACLPTSLVSPRPPSPLLPLLSPILKQKVDLFSALSSSSSDPWLKHLCWGESNAAALQQIIEESVFEPHPVSGELEVPEHLSICYKKFDEETLRARLSLSPDYNLTVVYVWCTGIADEGGAAWKVTELLPGDCPQATSGTWFSSIDQAIEVFEKSREISQENKLHTKSTSHADHGVHKLATEEAEEKDGDDDDDDDDYWAMYDNNGGETPGHPAPDSTARKGNPGLADSGYYDQYDNVQPALDVDDPSINRNDLGESSLNGDLLASMLRRHAELFPSKEEDTAEEEEENQEPASQQQSQPASEQQRVLFPEPNASSNRTAEESTSRINHPRPSLSSSSSSSAISKLEETAETHYVADNAIKQHMSMSVKSLFRLAKSTGMSKAEFKLFINEEMDGLRSDSE